jgi:sugar lactone lactonase YvrE
MQRRHLLALAPLALAARPTRAQDAPEILARYPSGTFLENLLVEPEGRVLFTNYFARRIERWSPGAGAGTLSDVPAHPVSLTALGDGRLALAAHGASFLQGPAALRGTGAVLLLARDGAVLGRIALPDAIFPNGGLLIAPGRMLLADSALGRIWMIDIGAGVATPWLDHPLLAPPEGQRNPGVNGLKLRGEELLASNSATRRLLRVRLAAGAPAGPPEVIAEMTGGVDDFAIGGDGTVFAATHASGLARLAPGASTPDTIPAPRVEGSTAVALTPDGRGLYALGTGGLTSGGRGDAVLARLRIG